MICLGKLQTTKLVAQILRQLTTRQKSAFLTNHPAHDSLAVPQAYVAGPVPTRRAPGPAGRCMAEPRHEEQSRLTESSFPFSNAQMRQSLKILGFSRRRRMEAESVHRSNAGVAGARDAQIAAQFSGSSCRLCARGGGLSRDRGLWRLSGSRRRDRRR